MKAVAAQEGIYPRRARERALRERQRLQTLEDEERVQRAPDLLAKIAALKAETADEPPASPPLPFKSPSVMRATPAPVPASEERSAAAPVGTTVPDVCIEVSADHTTVEGFTKITNMVRDELLGKMRMLDFGVLMYFAFEFGRYSRKPVAYVDVTLPKLASDLHVSRRALVESLDRLVTVHTVLEREDRRDEKGYRVGTRYVLHLEKFRQGPADG